MPLDKNRDMLRYLLVKDEGSPTLPVQTFDTTTLETSDAWAVKGLLGIG